MVKYPIGQQDFKGIRERGYVYVDKTDFIPLLLNNKYYFLSRPRRFGKSLFISTLEYFFLGQRELFTGLAVDSYQWDWLSYPVIHLDLNGTDYTKEESSLEETLRQQLREVEKKYGIDEFNGSLSSHFKNLILRLYEKTGRETVVLIDEYEKPVLDNIRNNELSEIHRATLRGFYGVLKSMDRYLKMVFITGVTKFGKMSIFSELNNIEDISIDDEFSAICGITEEELLLNFKEGISHLAEIEGLSYEEAAKELKTNYDGYHFSRNCSDIYNPYSILTALKKKEIRGYWFNTGSPDILIHALLKANYKPEDLTQIKVSVDQLMDIGIQLDDPVPLFYQSGYLTIKHYNPTTKLYTLGFPNREVEVAFYKYLIPYYLTKTQKERFGSYFHTFVEGIIGGKPQTAMDSLEAFSASIDYTLIPAPEMERHFQDMMYMYSRLLLPYTAFVKTEEHTSDGRVDLLIMTKDYIYIIEIKRDSSAEEALRQIEEKQYALQYKTDCRKVFKIGVNFSTDKRRIDSYKIIGD